MRRYWLTPLVLLYGITLLTACGAHQQTPTSPSTQLPGDGFTEIDIPVGYGYVSDSLDVYFTDPLDAKGALIQDGLDRVLAAAIDSARVSVDIAVYSLDNYVISYAIIRAKEKGVSVRMVVEGDNMDTNAIQNLIDNGIEVQADGRSGLMHNKLMVIDRSEVWTGSMNYTYSGVYEDHNVLIRSESPEVVANYEAEFLELIGKSAETKTQNPVLSINGHEVQNLFSPDDQIAYTMVDLLNGAASSIQFLEYTFTADDYAEIMIEKASSGVVVSGIIDANSVNAAGSDFEMMSDAGISIVVAKGAGLMHHKTVIIDHQIVVIGSYNFTAAAEKKNDENMMIFFDADLAKLFEDEFNRIQNSQ